MDLFGNYSDQKTVRSGKPQTPLADRMRPQTLEEFVGQQHLVNAGRVLRQLIANDALPSVIFWGPPGCGKTTLARLIAARAKSHFVEFSAVASGVADVKRVVSQAQERQKLMGESTILFVDEIHRFNKSQQDAFLPHVEKRAITLIGATTQNPSFEVIGPLLSRCRVFVLEQLSPEDLQMLVTRALTDSIRGLGERKLTIDLKACQMMCHLAGGDARIALNTLEIAADLLSKSSPARAITLDVVKEATQHSSTLYDKNGDEHYNQISAFIKAMRGSDPDGALYWMTRMLEAGEEPLFIARRMVVLASEDIGNADPQALPLAVACMQAVDFVGMPEAQLNLSQCAIYLSCAPKSNASYQALLLAKRDAQKTINQPVPLHVRNAPTKLTKQLLWGKGYQYAHDFPQGWVKQRYRPDSVEEHVYYRPTDRGYEKEIKRFFKKGVDKQG